MGFLSFLFVAILVLLLLAGFSANFLSLQLHRRLVKIGNPYARTYRIIAFIVSFLVIFLGLTFVILYNIRIER